MPAALCIYCDTEYAFSGGYLLSLAEIATQVASHEPHYVTVTGGEPLAQPNCLAPPQHDCVTPVMKFHWKRAGR